MSNKSLLRQGIVEAEFSLEQESGRSDYCKTDGHRAVAVLANWARQENSTVALPTHKYPHPVSTLGCVPAGTPTISSSLGLVI